MSKQILHNIYNKISIKEQVEIKKIESIIENVFLKIRTDLSSDNYPNILIKDFFRFEPRIYKLEKKLLEYLSNVINKDYKTYENFITKINSYKRLCKEQNKEPLEEILSLEKKIIEKNEFSKNTCN